MGSRGSEGRQREEKQQKGQQVARQANYDLEVTNELLRRPIPHTVLHPACGRL